MDIIQFFDDWITGRTKILRENAYQLSKTQLEEKIQDRAIHVSSIKHFFDEFRESDVFAKQLISRNIFFREIVIFFL